MNKNYYVLRIIDILNSIKNDEDDCCEGSLTDDAFICIIQLLVDLYRCEK